MKRGWFIFCLISWLTISHLPAQPIALTRVVVMPKRTTLDKPASIDLRMKGRPVKQLSLTYEQNDFYIYFQTPDVPPPYAYQLKDGYVHYELSTVNQYAFFTNIPNGDYEFSVRAVRRPDLPPARLKIRIESPVWLRWWFLPLLFLYGMLLVGIIFYFLYRYRLRQFMRLHAVRETIARDLHDDMGSYLSSISVMSQSIENLTEKDPAKAHALVRKIGETARQVMDSMGDIIWSVNPDNDSMTQIVVRMRDVGADLLEGQDVVFNLDLDETLLHSHLPLEQRRDFFLIYKEALTNIAKYAQATHVWVKLAYQEADLLLTIQDDGLGFDVQQPVRSHSLSGNGLKNMRARAEKMGGTLTLTSTPGLGTTVTLKIGLV